MFWVGLELINILGVQGYGQGSSTNLGGRGFQAQTELLGVDRGPIVDWEFSAWGWSPRSEKGSESGVRF